MEERCSLSQRRTREMSFLLKASPLWQKNTKCFGFAKDGRRCGGRGVLWADNYCWCSDAGSWSKVTEARGPAGRRFRKSDLYDGGRRQVTSAPAKLCAPASRRLIQGRRRRRRRVRAAMEIVKEERLVVQRRRSST